MPTPKKKGKCKMQTPAQVQDDIKDFLHENNICLCPLARDISHSQYGDALKSRGIDTSAVMEDVTHKCMADDWSAKLVTRLDSNGSLNFTS